MAVGSILGTESDHLVGEARHLIPALTRARPGRATLLGALLRRPVNDDH